MVTISAEEHLQQEREELSVHLRREILNYLFVEIDLLEKKKCFVAGEEEYEHLLLDIQSWSLRCEENNKSKEQFEVGEEDLAHMELDPYLRDLSPP